MASLFFRRKWSVMRVGLLDGRSWRKPLNERETKYFSLLGNVYISVPTMGSLVVVGAAGRGER